MDADQITKHLTTFIVEELLYGDDNDLDEHTPLLDLHIIESRNIPEILIFIERELGVEVPANEVSPRNFMSIAVLRGMVLRLQQARA